MYSLPYLFFDEPGTWRTRQRNLGVLTDDDFFRPLSISRSLLGFPDYLRDLRNLSTALQQEAASSVSFDKDTFQANFDVQHFQPEEISVKVTGDNTITIEAKHEEKQDEHGQIYRHFVRKYVLPKQCDIGRIESKLSSDGVLTITAPTTGEKVEHRSIPISQTGKPAKSIEKKKNKMEVDEKK
ncbi:alpha-crystallin B chain-like [Leptinotarsa decemlineata]|uniref:alpha-crystallin B chain-like n=1 Tax=Leptinotarsa decemlineata TaxID=7539 RepID=UPI003D307998